MSMVTAIVSPSARPKPRITAPKIPVRALRKTAIRNISQRVAPSAKTASFWFCGTAAITSRVMEVTMGITMMARINPAASMPIPYAGPSKSPVQRKCAARNGSTRRERSGARTKIPHSP